MLEVESHKKAQAKANQEADEEEFMRFFYRSLIAIEFLKVLPFLLDSSGKSGKIDNDRRPQKRY